MVNQTATGTTWDGAGFNDLDSRFLERGKLRQVLIRDARGAVTDMSPHNSDGTLRWTPFAADNTWRADLCAFKRVSGGWINNPLPNEGFHIAGAFRDGNGPNSKPTIRNDNFLILQSNFPFDSDLIEEGEPFSFMAVETAKPFIRRLRNNLPLNAPNGAVLVEDPGDPNAGWSRPLDGNNIERQVLLVSEFEKGGLPLYQVEGFNMAKLDGIGASKKDKRDSEAAELTYMPLPDGFFMAMVDGVYRPILKHTWVGGAGWSALSAGLPVFSASAPVATPGTAGKAAIALPDPTGPDAPYTNEVVAQYSADGGVTWLPATLDTTGVTSTGGTTTIHVTGVPSGSKQFRAQITDDGVTVNSPPSTAVTIL